MHIASPTLLIDEQKCRANIKKMVEKARSNHLIFRPHFKTHQSKEVGEWFKAEGTTAITVSSLGMAAYFANAGWSEITVAFPVNLRQNDIINDLAGRITLNLLTDNSEVISQLDQVLKHEVNIYIEIDSGAGRTGIPCNDYDRLNALLTAIDAAGKIHMKGFYTHAGHSYNARSARDIMSIFNDTVACMRSVRKWAEQLEFQGEYCMGDTPGCSVGTDFEGIDAISPGNFVFYDVMQTVIGSCNDNEIAVAVACPVVSKRSSTHEICIYGGAVHFSKDSIENGGMNIFGKIVALDKNKWTSPLEGCYVKALSQEHGIVKLSEEQFHRIQTGDVIGVVPVHSCLTAEALGYYQTFEGLRIDHYAQKNRD